MDDALAQAAIPLGDDDRSWDALGDLIEDARVVLIGEASHGTHEFYAERAAITRRLISERDFAAVCIEGDWPDAHRVHEYIQGFGDDASAAAALSGFTRFPTWMWANEVVRGFVDWARAWNAERPVAERAGFYGLDLYSMFTSMHSVLAYLERVDPIAAVRARQRYGCFEHFDEDSQTYGYAVAAQMAEPCEEEAVRQLVDLRVHERHYLQQDGRPARDLFFSAEQNARLVANAEHYYRSMYRGRASSWNLRDRHMADTMDAILDHLEATGRSPKVVVWAHNSHIGDARYTDMQRRKELNLGQLARERHGDAARLIGFSTHTGTVTAAHDWDEPGMHYRVRPSLGGSWERRFHELSEQIGADRFLVRIRGDDEVARALSEWRLQRAIGVIYRPETERASHYYDVQLGRQFDAMIHIDTTSALRGLVPGEHWERGAHEPAETYPSGL
jgi:erythromycin esterase-like protein